MPTLLEPFQYAFFRNGIAVATLAGAPVPSKTRPPRITVTGWANDSPAIESTTAVRARARNWVAILITKRLRER